MSIRRKKAFCLMVLIKHVISIPLPHMKRTPFRPSRQSPPSVLPAKGPLLSFPTLVIGNPESSLPDVSFSDVQRFPEVMVGPGTSGVGAERPLFDADP